MVELDSEAELLDSEERTAAASGERGVRLLQAFRTIGKATESVSSEGYRG
jgi:hypothetical protein